MVCKVYVTICKLVDFFFFFGGFICYGVSNCAWHFFDYSSSANSESELTTESGTFLKMGHQTVTAQQIGRAQDDICNNPPAVLIADGDCHNYKAKDWERGHVPRTGNCIVNSRTQEQVSCGATHGTTTERLPLAAVVIRRPGAKAAYGSPVKVRTEASRNPELWSRDLRPVKERSLVFGNSPLGCLQAVVEDQLYILRC